MPWFTVNLEELRAVEFTVNHCIMGIMAFVYVTTHIFKAKCILMSAKLINAILPLEKIVPDGDCKRVTRFISNKKTLEFITYLRHYMIFPHIHVFISQICALIV